ncbi:protein germ cell-less [Anopheles stephensi]|uniref:protein germ cell-less n=1 Tax=Anopheles stephensi TaxID=30069 RepID=UPI0016588061|nr:protein germ cell-less [Anopheles stephensi]XP_035898268.1 protein germ cell-less [Anopheles stephensi]XP_035898269.1 protein germ cell-less [Anopheles stephensi]XP_035898270.1 protein germ cell-less [Anopheles stephensi]
MGNVLNNLGSSVSQAVRARKRKRGADESADEGGDGSDLLDQSLQTPKRKKLVSTAKYIYQALFKEERNSDVTVHALGKQWHLHKVYLSQSPYFASMFNGSWREADEDYVHIEIIDPKITIESLYSVFGSLYMDEVVLDPKEIISTLATATLFQLDSLIERCAEVMVETTTAETAVLYYEAACEYGVKTVKESTFGWLLVNLLSFYHRAPRWLRLISVDLMVRLVSSADLYVVQTEFTIYLLLRYWMTLRIFPHEPAQDGAEHPQERYFAKRTSNVPFLATPQGGPFRPAFRAMRLQNLLNHHVDIQILRADKIIPMKWLHKPLLQQWTSLLTIDQSLDRLIECDDRVFLESCVRCGRILNENVLHKWRWTGFHFGLDLLLSSDTRSLRIRRHHRTEHERLLSLRVKRQFLVRVSLASLNELRQIKHQQTTPIISITLEKNEDTQLLVFDQELTFPVLVSLNMMLVPPPEEAPGKGGRKAKEKGAHPASSSRTSENQSAGAGGGGGGGGGSSSSTGTVESLDGGSSSNRVLLPNES